MMFWIMLTILALIVFIEDIYFIFIWRFLFVVDRWFLNICWSLIFQRKLLFDYFIIVVINRGFLLLEVILLVLLLIQMEWFMWANLSTWILLWFLLFTIVKFDIGDICYWSNRLVQQREIFIDSSRIIFWFYILANTSSWDISRLLRRYFTLFAISYIINTWFSILNEW